MIVTLMKSCGGFFRHLASWGNGTDIRLFYGDSHSFCLDLKLSRQLGLETTYTPQPPIREILSTHKFEAQLVFLWGLNTSRFPGGRFSWFQDPVSRKSDFLEAWQYKICNEKLSQTMIPVLKPMCLKNHPFKVIINQSWATYKNHWINRLIVIHVIFLLCGLNPNYLTNP